MQLGLKLCKKNENKVINSKSHYEESNERETNASSDNSLFAGNQVMCLQYIPSLKPEWTNLIYLNYAVSRVEVV